MHIGIQTRSENHHRRIVIAIAIAIGIAIVICTIIIMPRLFIIPKIRRLSPVQPGRISPCMHTLHYRFANAP